jgi:hypothetical protein
VDRVHDGWRMGPLPSACGSTTQIKKREGVSDNLIVALNVGMDIRGESADKGGTIAAARPALGGSSPE